MRRTYADGSISQVGMGQDQPEALGRVFEVLAGGLGGTAYLRFGRRVQAGAEPEQIHRASRSDGAHVLSRRAGDARGTEGVAPLIVCTNRAAATGAGFRDFSSLIPAKDNRRHLGNSACRISLIAPKFSEARFRTT